MPQCDSLLQWAPTQARHIPYKWSHMGVSISPQHLWLYAMLKQKNSQLWLRHAFQIPNVIIRTIFIIQISQKSPLHCITTLLDSCTYGPCHYDRFHSKLWRCGELAESRNRTVERMQSWQHRKLNQQLEFVMLDWSRRWFRVQARLQKFTVVTALAQHFVRAQSRVHTELSVEVWQVSSVGHLVEVGPIEKGEHHAQGWPDVLRDCAVHRLHTCWAPSGRLHV